MRLQYSTCKMRKRKPSLPLPEHRETLCVIELAACLMAGLGLALRTTGVCNTRTTVFFHMEFGMCSRWEGIGGGASGILADESASDMLPSGFSPGTTRGCQTTLSTFCLSAHLYIVQVGLFDMSLKHVDRKSQNVQPQLDCRTLPGAKCLYLPCAKQLVDPMECSGGM